MIAGPFHCTSCGGELPGVFASDDICSVCLNQKVILGMLKKDGVIGEDYER